MHAQMTHHMYNRGCLVLFNHCSLCPPSPYSIASMECRPDGQNRCLPINYPKYFRINTSLGIVCIASFLVLKLIDQPLLMEDLTLDLPAPAQCLIQSIYSVRVFHIQNLRKKMKFNPYILCSKNVASMAFDSFTWNAIMLSS